MCVGSALEEAPGVSPGALRGAGSRIRRCFEVKPMPLGVSWVVISGVISPLIRVISIVTLLITPLITTREPPSRL